MYGDIAGGVDAEADSAVSCIENTDAHQIVAELDHDIFIRFACED